MTFVPDFPVREGKNKNRSNFTIGIYPDQWETTNKTDYTPKEPETNNNQRISTKVLTKTHWNMGGFNDKMISETHASFKKIEGFHNEVVPGANFQRTSFSIGDQNMPFEQRTLMPKYPVQPPASANSKELRKSHIILPNNDKEKWTTESRESLKYIPGEPAKAVDNDLRGGQGVYETVHNHCVYNEPVNSLSKDSYTKPNVPYLPIPKTIVLDGGYASARIEPNRLTTFNLGSEKTNYQTTMRDAAYPKTGRLPPPSELHYPEQRNRYSRGIIPKDERLKVSSSTTTSDAFKAYPGFKPPKPTALTRETHYTLGTWKEPWTTTSEENFVKYPPQEPTQIVNNNLRQSNIGFPKLDAPKTSLYQNDFIKKPTPERADINATRKFNLATHSKVCYETSPKTGRSVYKTDFHKFDGFQKTEQCPPMPNANIINKDKKLKTNPSEMKDSYVPYKNVEVTPMCDNALQSGHIKMAVDGCNNWETTQQQYFQFKTYNTSRI